MRILLLRWYAAAFVLLAILLNTCSSPPLSAGHLPPAFTGVRIVSVDGISEMTAGIGTGDLRQRTLHGAVLDGPHYTMAVGWIATGTTLDDATARELGIAAARAPEGRQLVMAGIDPSYTYAAFGRKHVDVNVTVAGRTTPVPGLPLPPQPSDLPADMPASRTSIILVSAPRNAPLRLRATDAGRTEELDLRTGRVLADSFDIRQSDTLHWSGSRDVECPPADGVSAQGELTAGVTNLDTTTVTEAASLSSYLPGYGWAPKGLAILIVPAPSLEASGNLILCGAAHEQFNDRDVFTFHARNNVTVRAMPYQRDIDLLRSPVSGDSTPITFLVPANTASGKVIMDLGHARLTTETGYSTVQDASPKRMTIHWAKTPAPFTLKIALTS